MFVSDLTGDKATIVVRKWIPGEGSAEHAESELRLVARRAPRAAVRVSPRRSDDLDFILRHRGRKKKRADRIRRRRRAGVILGVFAIVVIVAVLSVGLGAGAALSQSCDLNTLRPVEIGQNSFVFARDGSRARLDPGRAQPRAGLEPPDVEVAAARDRLDRGPALLPARRRRLRGHRARRVEGRDRRQGRRGRLDDHAAARPQPLHRPGEDVQPQGEGGVPRDQALEQVVEVEDPQRVPEHRLLRQPRLRRRGGVADVLLEARVAADAARVGDARRAAAGAVRSTTRSTTRRRRSTAATRCCARCSRTAR